MNYYNWIIPILLLITTSGFYIGYKLKEIIPWKEKKRKKIYWIIILIITACIILFRSILAGFFLYFIILNLIFDFAKWIAHLLKAQKATQFLQRIYYHGIPIIIMCIAITIYGAYNINHPIVKEYSITINEKLKDTFTIGMISDMHLGIIHQEEYLDQTVEHANELNADIFILGGDIFDEYTSDEIKQMAYQKLGSIKTKYGVFYVEGNHDLLTDETKENFEKNNIQVLDDKVMILKGQINLIGRKDYRNNKLGNQRKDLEELIKETDSNLPIILIDHQPVDQENAEKIGVDLQLSGHTHAGQIFPGNIFLQYGYKKKNKYQIIVSSGYGVWGFPIRTAGRSEMIKVTLTK